MKDSNFKQVPKPIQVKAKEHSTAIIEMTSQVTAVCERATTDPLSFTMEEMRATIKQGTLPSALPEIV